MIIIIINIYHRFMVERRSDDQGGRLANVVLRNSGNAPFRYRVLLL